jgi:hypothetical protein
MKLSFTWQPRSIPLTPAAVGAEGDVARLLARRLLIRDDEALAQLSGVAGPELILLLGPEVILPWVDGAFYLGRDVGAPTLLLPTTLEPSVPLLLLERALRRQTPELSPPLAVLPAARQVVSLAAARTVVRETLTRWLEGKS